MTGILAKLPVPTETLGGRFSGRTFCRVTTVQKRTIRLTTFMVALIASAVQMLAAADATILVISAEEGACVMLGHYTGGGFSPASELANANPDKYRAAAERLLGLFREGDAISGLDSKRRKVNAVITSINTAPELGESSLQLTSRPATNRRLALLARPKLPIIVLSATRTRLTEAIDRQLRMRIDELWKAHLPERSPEEQPIRFEVLKPLVERLPEEPDILVVRYPLDLIEPGGGRDDRAQAFFMYSVTERRIIRAAFGHPEWAFTSSVLTIQPEVYFRIAGDSRTYFVGLHEGGWEDTTRALYDFRTGQAVLLCY